MAREFRDADLFTLTYAPRSTWPELEQFNIRTHWLSRFVKTHHAFKVAFPLMALSMQMWDFSGYDLILTSSATTAKYVRRHKGIHVCYCYFPTRAIWSTDAYFSSERRSLSQAIFLRLLPWMRKWDRSAADHVHHFIAISNTTRQAIQKFYQRDAGVLFSPIDTAQFRPLPGVTRKSYFLLVGRLEYWKRTDYAVEAFTRLGLPLRIIGTGEEEARLRSMAGPNIEFMGRVTDEELRRCYTEARAVVFTPVLEYGLVPLEACAAGTPSIAVGREGVLETMVGLDDPAGRPATAVFFQEQTADALIEAVRKFEQVTFDRQTLINHAEQFSIENFCRQLRKLVMECADKGLSNL